MAMRWVTCSGDMKCLLVCGGRACTRPSKALNLNDQETTPKPQTLQPLHLRCTAPTAMPPL